MNVLLDILVVLVAAKLAAEGAERLGIPGVVAEIVAGVIVGPSVLGLVGPDEVLRVLGEIGVILLLVDVGLQMDLGGLRAVGRTSTAVAAVGVVTPFALGWAAATALGLDGQTPIFVGAALTATSVGITARVFSDLRALASVEARTVLGAAVADDVMGLVILTVVVRLATGESVTLGTVAVVVGVALLFLVATGTLGALLTPSIFKAVNRFARTAGTLVALALAFTLGFAELAQLAGLAPIVGAFVAGLSLARSDQAERINRELTPVGHLFIPVFFLQIGIDADIASFVDPDVLLLAAGLMAAAVLGKLASALGALGTASDRPLIGLGMLPRGEVGLIFAGIGLREGILGQDAYAALIAVVLGTTLAAPPLLRWRLSRVRSSARGFRAATPRPEGGWLRVDGGLIHLQGTPPDHLTLHVALEAALLASRTRPGPSVLDWLGSTSEVPLRWDRQATALLFRILGEGNIRTWRLLEASGVLERGLPELAQAVRRRRADPFELDPANLLRWSLIERLRDAVDAGGMPAEHYAALAHREWLLLAALILESAGEDQTPVEAARQLVKRLDLGAAAEQEIALLVGESGLLRAAALRADALKEQKVLPIAVHLDSVERARALYLLTLALGGLDPAARRRLDELTSLVLVALAHPELTGRPARNLLERRRSEAARLVGTGSSAAARIAAAPLGYLLSQDSVAIARQAALLEPLPPRHQARVVVHPAERTDGRYWRVEVAARDRPGLLSAVTGVLTAHGLDVVEAVVATWDDGAALDSFVVKQGRPPSAPSGNGSRPSEGAPPDPSRLEADLAAVFDRPQAAAPVEDATVTFDDEGSPWYTLAEVRCTDRPGLLHSLATAVAAAGANVHSAVVTTHEGLAVDRFELTDRRGAKLDPRLQESVRSAVTSGTTAWQRRQRVR